MAREGSETAAQREGSLWQDKPVAKRQCTHPSGQGQPPLEPRHRLGVCIPPRGGRHLPSRPRVRLYTPTDFFHALRAVSMWPCLCNK